MRRTLLLIAVGALCSAASANAATITFTTGQTNAQTQIDVNHSTIWNFDLVAVNIDTVVANLELKRGPQTAVDISACLYDAPNGTGTELKCASKPFSDITQAFTPGYLFTLTGFAPTPLPTGDYSLVVKSSAPDSQNVAYFIKGSDQVTVEPQGSTTLPIEVVPEPTSMLLLATGLAGLVARRRQSE